MFHLFKNNSSGIAIPARFTFPFYYEPHPLATLAAQELQEYLQHQKDFEHNFGLTPHQKGMVIGKMFGVLVCKNKEGQLGYLWAFSGKLAEQNQLQYFVPPVFDMLSPSSFFHQEQAQINRINQKIEHLGQQTDYQNALLQLSNTQTTAQQDIIRYKNHIKTQKKNRQQQRLTAQNTLDAHSLATVLQTLSEESQQEAILLKKMQAYWQYKITDAQKEVAQYEQPIHQLKALRKQKSNQLQQRLFAEYTFLNCLGEHKSLGQLFDNNPPAGAGECAAPKLLHYAFQHHYTPICMAEFWWGQSPKSEVRKHQQFYPSCKSKCEPILLNHMLKGLHLEENPFIKNTAEDQKISLLYEDDAIAVINKPAELLSVPGKLITDSVYTRMRAQYPNATGPLIVHRLDMSTSGIMLIAKTEAAYHHLQNQFIKRRIQKKYEALLNGTLAAKNGSINLPLRVDLEDRPRQLVCYDYGKKALTKWEAIGIENDKTRVHFYPITGRTHQLRVHASHHLGLHTPIVGDDLYGTKANRLHLHAQSISFRHPSTEVVMHLVCKAPF